MYTIYADDHLIYNPLLPDYQITSGKCDLAVNSAGSLTFTIPTTHPNYGKVELMKSTVELYDDDRLIFQGRPYAPTLDFFRNDRIECEGALAYLNDSIIEPFEYTGSAAGFFSQIIASHNSQVDSSRQFTIGDSDATFNITRSSIEYLSAWDVLSEKLIGEASGQAQGGYVKVRRENGVNYIDYLSLGQFAGEGNQQVLQGVNLLDAEKATTSDTLATVIIPLGARLEDANGIETDERLTIGSVNSGKNYLEDTTASATYGRITKVVIHDDITVASNLKTAGQNDLNDALGVATTYTFKAANLAKAGYNVDSFELGDKIRVRVDSFGVDDDLLIRELSLNLLAPEEDVLLVGKTEKTLTSSMNNTNRAIESVRNASTKGIHTVAQKLGAVKFKTGSIAASGSVTFTVPANGRGFIFINGASNAYRGFGAYLATSAGTAGYGAIANASTSPSYSVTTSGSSLTISNNASTVLSYVIMAHVGALPS